MRANTSTIQALFCRFLSSVHFLTPLIFFFSFFLLVSEYTCALLAIVIIHYRPWIHKKHAVFSWTRRNTREMRCDIYPVFEDESQDAGSHLYQQQNRQKYRVLQHAKRILLKSPEKLITTQREWGEGAKRSRGSSTVPITRRNRPFNGAPRDSVPSGDSNFKNLHRQRK